MDRLERLKQKVLAKAEQNKAPINESRMTYEDGHAERMHPDLERALRERKHTLGTHPAFPDSDESHFEEKLMSKRFADVLKNYKRQFDVENVDPSLAISETMTIANECMRIEQKHMKELQDLAVNMIREEYQMEEDDVEIIAELTPAISFEGLTKNSSPITIEGMQFENHDSVKSANKEVYKRRFINAMIQGAAKKGHHMFHLAEKELTNLNPTLPNKYAKLMAGADYSYLSQNDKTQKIGGGLVKVEYKDGKPVIHAKAITFPVLIHELVKGVMEVLSAHGLPQDDQLTEYVLGKADFLNAEAWDMRIGTPIWERFTECIPSESFNKKHHVYAELVSLPVDEFNHVMREIMMGSGEGKARIAEIINQINEDEQRDAYEQTIREMNNDDSFGYDDLDGIDLDGF